MDEKAMKVEKGRYAFKVRSYECGADGKVTLLSLCNYLQEAASMDAGRRGFSKGDFAAAGSTASWVLTRLKVVVSRYSRWEDDLMVETFPRGGRKLVAWRDFEIRDAAGETVCRASSEWMLIDLASRKLLAVPQEVIDCRDDANSPVLGEEPFSKFRYPETGVSLGTAAFVAQKSHIDLNGHVNNVHYIEWMLEPCAKAQPTEVEVVFRSETFAGDAVGVEVVRAEGCVYHRVYAPEGKDHIVARTK